MSRTAKLFHFATFARIELSRPNGISDLLIDETISDAVARWTTAYVNGWSSLECEARFDRWLEDQKIECA